MTISLSNLTQILMFKVKMLTKAHKKKLIFALVLIITGYIAKKKLTFSHLLKVVEAITKLVQALPLPQSPELRKIAEYQHPNTVPLRAILDATQLDEIKRKISRKQAGWDELKQSITTCLVLALTLYNSSSIYFLIQNKYREQFIDLEASTEFQRAMYLARKRFTDQIPAIFSNIRATIFVELERIDLTRIYDQEELNSLFQALIEKILSNKFDVRKEPQISRIEKVKPEVKNLFASTYEYLPRSQTSSFIGKIGGSVLRFMGGMISITDWFPEAKLQITAERYLFLKMAYVQPLKKAANQLDHSKQIEWPNQKSKELFELVIEEINFTLTSLNFTTLLKSFSNLNLKILKNRLSLLFQVKQKTQMKFSQLLVPLYKIVQQEFLKSNQYQLREKYHNSELKKVFKLLSELEDEEEPQDEEKVKEGKSLQENVMEEIELKERFLFLEKQLELKIFNERSGITMRPKNSGSGKDEADQMKKLLGMMSSNDALLNQD